MTTQTKPTFRERLSPFPEMQDLETRAHKAAEYCHEAIAAGDLPKFDKAFARLLQRWEQWDAIAPKDYPRRGIIQDRAGVLLGLLEAIGQEGEMFEAALAQFYYWTRLTEAHTDPPSRTDLFDAEQWAARRMAVWMETGER